MSKVIMIHGWEGNADKGWFRWLQKELVAVGYKVEIPTMPHTFKPSSDKWVNKLKNTIGTSTEDIILIGHSLGVVTILKYLECLGRHEKIKAAILVAGFTSDLEREGYKGTLKNFFIKPVNFKKVKIHCDKFIIVHSKDDEWVKLAQAYVLHEKLQGELIIQEDMGHYSDDEGIVRLPIVLDQILSLP